MRSFRVLSCENSLDLGAAATALNDPAGSAVAEQRQHRIPDPRDQTVRQGESRAASLARFAAQLSTDGQPGHTDGARQTNGLRGFDSTGAHQQCAAEHRHDADSQHLVRVLSATRTRNPEGLAVPNCRLRPRPHTHVAASDSQGEGAAQQVRGRVRPLGAAGDAGLRAAFAALSGLDSPMASRLDVVSEEALLTLLGNRIRPLPPRRRRLRA